MVLRRLSVYELDSLLYRRVLSPAEKPHDCAADAADDMSQV